MTPYGRKNPQNISRRHRVFDLLPIFAVRRAVYLILLAAVHLNLNPTHDGNHRVRFGVYIQS